MPGGGACALPVVPASAGVQPGGMTTCSGPAIAESSGADGSASENATVPAASSASIEATAR